MAVFHSQVQTLWLDLAKFGSGPHSGGIAQAVENGRKACQSHDDQADLLPS